MWSSRPLWSVTQSSPSHVIHSLEEQLVTVIIFFSIFWNQSNFISCSNWPLVLQGDSTDGFSLSIWHFQSNWCYSYFGWNLNHRDISLSRISCVHLLCCLHLWVCRSTGADLGDQPPADARDISSVVGLWITRPPLLRQNQHRLIRPGCMASTSWGPVSSWSRAIGFSVLQPIMFLLWSGTGLVHGCNKTLAVHLQWSNCCFPGMLSCLRCHLHVLKPLPLIQIFKWELCRLKGVKVPWEQQLNVDVSQTNHG